MAIALTPSRSLNPVRFTKSTITRGGTVARYLRGQSPHQSRLWFQASFRSSSAAVPVSCWSCWIVVTQWACTLATFQDHHTAFSAYHGNATTPKCRVNGITYLWYTMQTPLIRDPKRLQQAKCPHFRHPVGGVLLQYLWMPRWWEIHGDPGWGGMCSRPAIPGQNVPGRRVVQGHWACLGCPKLTIPHTEITLG